MFDFVLSEEQDFIIIFVGALFMVLIFLLWLYHAANESKPDSVKENDKILELVNQITNTTHDEYFDYKVVRFETKGTKNQNRTFSIELIATQKNKTSMIIMTNNEKECPEYVVFWPHIQCVYNSSYMLSKCARLIQFTTEAHQRRNNCYKISIKLNDY